MNWLDVLLIVVIAWSAVSGLRKGLTREIFGLASALAALLAATLFYGSLGSYLAPYVSSRNVAAFCGFLIVFVGVLILGSVLGHFSGRLIRMAGLTWFDRLLGGGFGVVRGVLISVGLIMVFTAFAPGASGNTPPAAVTQSRIAPYVIDMSRAVSALAPRELKDEFRKRYEQVKNVWEQAWRKA